MYRIFPLLFLLLSSSLCIAQPAIEWSKCYGGTSYDGARSIVATSDGGYIFAGETMSIDGDVKGLHQNTDQMSGNADYWVVKINSVGKLQWQKCLGGYGDEQGTNIIQTKDGGYAVVGYTYPDSANDGDIHTFGGFFSEGIWFVKLDSVGVIQWQKAVRGYNTRPNAIIQAQDGGFVIAGYTTSKNGDIVGLHFTDGTDPEDGLIVKLDTVGNIQWQLLLGGYNRDIANSIINTFDGGYIVAATTGSDDGDVNDSHGDNDVWIIKLNEGGKVEWKKTYGGSQYDKVYSIFQKSDSGFIFIGYTTSVDGDVKLNPDSGGYWMVKLKSNGEIESERVLPNSKKFPNYFITTSSDRGYIFAGSVKSDFSMVKFNGSGDFLWQKTLGGSYGDGAFSVAESKDGGYIIAGEASSIDGDVIGSHDSVKNSKGGQLADAWIVKLFPDKNSVNPLTKSSENNISIFPNPNTGIGKIKYSLNKPSQVRIEVYDAIGRSLRIITNDFELSGDHELPFDLTELPSGQYFFHLQSEGISIMTGFELVK
jgi:hypothetical protein